MSAQVALVVGVALGLGLGLGLVGWLAYGLVTCAVIHRPGAPRHRLRRSVPHGRALPPGHRECFPSLPRFVRQHRASDRRHSDPQSCMHPPGQYPGVRVLYWG